MAPVKKPKPLLGKHFLQEWRVAKGIGQQEAATAINLSRTMLSKIENGEHPYQQQYVEGLARLYGCRPTDLIGSDPANAPQDDEARLRSALLAFGVDVSDLGRAVSSVRVFVDDRDEQRSPAPLDDQSEHASRRHEEVPSR